jgi:hypothetical protein
VPHQIQNNLYHLNVDSLHSHENTPIPEHVNLAPTICSCPYTIPHPATCLRDCPGTMIIRSEASRPLQARLMVSQAHPARKQGSRRRQVQHAGAGSKRGIGASECGRRRGCPQLASAVLFARTGSPLRLLPRLYKQGVCFDRFIALSHCLQRGTQSMRQRGARKAD